MALRPEGPGKDFDDMWEKHRRDAFPKKAAGQGPWQADHVRAHAGELKEPDQRGKHAKPNSDSCIVPLALLGGLGWALSEVAGRIF